MSQHVPKSKENGVKSEKSPGKHACPPGPHAHPHPEAGDDSASDTGSDVPPVPENIQKRVNALKNIHMDVQRIEQEMYTKLFQLEAEQHKKMVALLQKRAEIVKGSYEPTEKESTFSLKDDEEKPEIAPATQDAGVPDFWLTIFQRASQTAMTLNEEDCKVLSYLTDVRCIYLEKPLGFKLEFEFKENPYFTNTILMRSYEFGQEVGAEDLYLSSGLAPKTTAGCDIQWKTGKDTSKKETATFQRNKRTGARREIKKVEEVESFFKPSVTDLASLSNVEEDGDEKAMQALSDSAEQAEMDFELASYIRIRVIPRALLIFTGDDDDDMSYGGEEDYDEEDDEDDDDEGAGASDDDDSDELGDAAKEPTRELFSGVLHTGYDEAISIRYPDNVSAVDLNDILSRHAVSPDSVFMTHPSGLNLRHHESVRGSFQNFLTFFEVQLVLGGTLEWERKTYLVNGVATAVYTVVPEKPSSVLCNVC